jgi:hypothetical protein
VARFLAPSYLAAVALTLGVISAGSADLRAQTAVPAAPPAQAAPAAPAAPAPSAPAAATPENAAPFLGDWTLSTTGSNGPATTALSIKVDAGKVTAEVSSEAQGRIAVTDIKKAGPALTLSYGFDYQGMAIPVVITLTPAAEQVTAVFDFANGAYQMSGTATKKK